MRVETRVQLLGWARGAELCRDRDVHVNSFFTVLQMEGLLVDNLHEQDQRLYDRLRTAHEHQLPAMISI